MGPLPCCCLTPSLQCCCLSWNFGRPWGHTEASYSTLSSMEELGGKAQVAAEPVSSAVPIERWDPICPLLPPNRQSHQPSQLHLRAQLESSFCGQSRQGLRTRMLPLGNDPQRHVGNVQQLCYHARRSQALACQSSSCCVCPRPLLGRGQFASEGKRRDSGTIHLQSATPSPRHSDRSTWLYSLFPSLKAGRQGCKR